VYQVRIVTPIVWNILQMGCRLVLAAVLMLAAVPKITDLHGFEDQVLLHSGLPPTLARLAIVVLPWYELTCSLCLALGFAVREAALLTAILLGCFVIYSLGHAGESDCGCFLFSTVQGAMQGWWHPLRDLLLLLCCWLPACKQRTAPGTSSRA